MLLHRAGRCSLSLFGGKRSCDRVASQIELVSISDGGEATDAAAPRRCRFAVMFIEVAPSCLATEISLILIRLSSFLSPFMCDIFSSLVVVLLLLLLGQNTSCLSFHSLTSGQGKKEQEKRTSSKDAAYRITAA